MANNPNGKGGFKKGRSGNPGGLTKVQAARREQVNELLLSAELDAEWLKAYRQALRDGVAPIILDYTYRRLGKPAETVNGQVEVTGAYQALTMEELRAFNEARRHALVDKTD